MASMAIGVNFSMISGIGGGDDANQVATAVRTTLKLNQKYSLSERTCRFFGIKKYRGSGAIRTVSKVVVDGVEVSRNLTESGTHLRRSVGGARDFSQLC